MSDLSPQAQVDLLLSRTKTIAGEPTWQSTSYDGQMRWLAPLSVDGEVTDLNLVVDAYPTHPSAKFNILLVLGRCVARLEYSEHTRHNNHALAGGYFPTGLEEGWIYGPHFHSWPTNRILATWDSLPKELEWAMLLPANVRGFDNAFRWFCGETRILCGANEVPDLPPRDRLL